VIVGGSIHMGKHDKHVVEFARNNGGGFGVDNQMQGGWLVWWIGVPFPASARGSGRVHDAGVPEPSRFMPEGDRAAARSAR
jgi:hypothetical protein